MAIEIDTRPIHGCGGLVRLLADTPLFSTYTVEVVDAEGFTVAHLQELDRIEARSAFLHTFARSDVPDIFSVHVRHLEEE